MRSQAPGFPPGATAATGAPGVAPPTTSTAADLYGHPPGTPRPPGGPVDPYSQQPGTPRPPDHFAQVPIGCYLELKSSHK